VPHPSFVENGVLQRDLLAKDGLHLSYAGTPVVIRDILSAVRTVRGHLRNIVVRTPVVINVTSPPKDAPSTYADILRKSTSPRLLSKWAVDQKQYICANQSQ
jgi:hypothetical protein